MKAFTITQRNGTEHTVLVDDEDYCRVLAAGAWFISSGRRLTYAARSVRRADGTWTIQRLHQFILGRNGIDHINGDGLDNRRANLRKATHAENHQNLRLNKNSTSGFRGVSRSGSRWRAYATLDGLQHDAILGGGREVSRNEMTRVKQLRALRQAFEAAEEFWGPEYVHNRRRVFTQDDDEEISRRIAMWRRKRRLENWGTWIAAIASVAMVAWSLTW